MAPINQKVAERLKKDFFEICPELSLEDVEFKNRKHSLCIIYNGNKVYVGTSSPTSNLPKKIRKMLGLESVGEAAPGIEDAKNDLIEYVCDNRIPAFQKGILKKSKGKTIAVSFAPKAECPLPAITVSMKVELDQTVEQREKAFQAALRKSLFGIKVNTRSPVYAKLLDDAMKPIRTAAQKEGIFDTAPEIQRDIPLCKILTVPARQAGFQWSVSQKGPVLLAASSGGIRLQYSLETNKISSCDDLAEIKKEIRKQLKFALRKQRIEKQFATHGVEKYKIMLKETKTTPSVIRIQISRPGFSWSEDVPLDATISQLSNVYNAGILKYETAKKEEEKNRQERQKKMRSDPFYGDLLVADIVRAVDEIRWNPAITYLKSYLRENSRIAKGYTVTYLEKKIDDLYDHGILRTSFSRSDYGTYTTYLLASKEHRIYAEPEPTHYGKDKQYEKYTDTDWVAFLENFDPGKEQSLSAWQQQTPFWGHQSVLLAYPEEAKKYYNAAPEQVKAYVRALYETSDDRSFRKAVKIFF